MTRPKRSSIVIAMRYFLVILVLLCVPAETTAQDAPPKTFVSASEESIDRIEALHQRAEELILQNDFGGAIGVLDEILLLEPDDEVAYSQMGHCYMILGYFERAEQAFQNALHINPENETALLGIQKIRDPDGVLTQQEIPLDQPAPDISDERDPLEQQPHTPIAEELKTTQSKLDDLTGVSENKIYTFEENIQRALKNAGLYEGVIDGSIGPASRKAIQNFQSSRGLKVDGKVGPETWAALQAYLELDGSPAQQT